MIYNYYNFKEINDKYLITNDLGKYLFLDKVEFAKVVNKEIEPESELFSKLEENFFVSQGNKELFIEEASQIVRNNKKYIFPGTQLHIFVLTNSCNINCIYCQASSNSKKKGINFMSREVAKNAVDIALSSPSKYLTFEFQGGEPLLNFDTLMFIVEYTQNKKDEVNKEVEFNLVSNFIDIDDYMIDFLIDNSVNISTSIDGNSEVHDFNRNKKGIGTLDIVERNLDRVRERYSAKGINRNIEAIQTTTKRSLSYSKEIIDEYLGLGFSGIFIRPLTPLGYSRLVWDKVGYEPLEFVNFYRKCLDYIIRLNKEGIKFAEYHAAIFLKKILFNEAINYMELRSPCGGGIGQLAYNYDGNIYTCDEGRMVAEMGDESFKLGDVESLHYNDLIDNEVTKSVAVSSCLECIPKCYECVYNPYCGTCPVYNYIEQGNIVGKMPMSYKCKIYSGILDCLFEKIQDEDTKNIFYSWIE